MCSIKFPGPRKFFVLFSPKFFACASLKNYKKYIVISLDMMLNIELFFAELLSCAVTIRNLKKYLVKTQVYENKNTFSEVISTHCEVVQPPKLA